jgi:outer membrane usher protein
MIFERRRSLLLLLVALLFPLLLLVGKRAFASSCGSELLFGVVLNGETVSEGTIFIETAGGYLLPASEAAEWRFKIPAAGGTICGGKRYVSLVELGVVSAQVNQENQALVIQAPASSFEKTVIESGMTAPPPPQRGSGLLLNYDLTVDRGSGTPVSYGGLAQAALFRREGIFDTSFVGVATEGKEKRLVRLETSWFRDDSNRIMTYRLGDSSTRPGLTGGWSRFAGFQVASNYSLRPGFTLQPLPSVIGGMAETASVVDILVNNARVSSSRVPQGPFDIPSIPAVSGRGEVAVVVHDLLGRERVLVQSYYLSPAILRKGLSDFSYGAGIRRIDYGRASNDYRGGIFSATHRYGFSDALTGDLHVEGVSRAATMETGGSFLLGGYGVATLSLSGSVNHGETGGQCLGAYEYQDGRFSFGGSYLQGSPRFREFGAFEDEPALSNRLVLATGFNLQPYGNISFTFTGRQRFDEERSRLVTAGYGISVGGGTLSLVFFRDVTDPHVYAGTASFTVVFDDRRTLHQEIRKTSDKFQGGAEVQQNLPPSGTGYAARLRAESRDNDAYVRGEVMRRGDAIDTDFWYSYDAGDHFFRGDASGSLVFMDGIVKASRRISQSFVLAEVPGFPDVTVYANNRDVGKTDSNGYIIIPDTRPYESNTVSFNAEELPLTTRIGGVQEVAVPAFLSGTHLRFPVTHETGVTAHFVTTDGKPLPAGTLLSDRKGHRWPVAKGGLAYLENLEPGRLEVEATIENRLCRAVLTIPVAGDDIPDVGTVTCEYR